MTDPECVCGEINARHCPVHSEPIRKESMIVPELSTVTDKEKAADNARLHGCLLSPHEQDCFELGFEIGWDARVTTASKTATVDPRCPPECPTCETARQTPHSPGKSELTDARGEDPHVEIDRLLTIYRNNACLEVGFAPGFRAGFLEAVGARDEEMRRLSAEIAALKTNGHANTLANTRDVYRGEKIVELNVALEDENRRLNQRITDLELVLAEIAPSWLPEDIRVRRREVLKAGMRSDTLKAKGAE